MDLIYAARYTEVCDYAWEDCQGSEIIPGGIWYVDIGAIPDFFQRIKGPYNRSQRYVIVSPSSDFGLHYQQYEHPANDLKKWVGLQCNPRTVGYQDINIHARINPQRCKETDKYSIKCWSYTAATFDEIPNNVTKWFLTNCEIQDERVVPIPFGVSGNKNSLDHVNLIDIRRKLPKTRDKLLYINFQFYTTDRYELYLHFSENYPDVVTCKQQVSFAEYLDDLATHKFVLCPTGNGLDCYRTLETIYMGAVPIMERRRGAMVPYQNVKWPVIAYPKLFQVDPYRLENEWKSIEETFKTQPIDLTAVKWSYWKQKILESAHSSTG